MIFALHIDDFCVSLINEAQRCFRNAGAQLGRESGPSDKAPRNLIPTEGHRQPDKISDAWGRSSAGRVRAAQSIGILNTVE
jgi:hypothetical protein